MFNLNIKLNKETDKLYDIIIDLKAYVEFLKNSNKK